MDHPTLTKFTVLSNALAEIKRTLPPLPSRPDDPTLPHLVPTYLWFYLCSIILWNRVINHLPGAYDESLESAFAMASMVRRVRIYREFAPANIPSQSLVNKFHTLSFLTLNSKP